MISSDQYSQVLGLISRCFSKDFSRIGVSPRRINEIVHGKRAVTADTDLRLSKALGTSEGFWLGLQADYDLEEKKISISAQLDKIQKLVNFDMPFAKNNIC